jgi:hypothetical protein
MGQRVERDAASLGKSLPGDALTGRHLDSAPRKIAIS